MTAYYNEIDPYAAQWLRNLIAAGHIAPGDVDERSIEDVRPSDLRGYAQCHFFAGIGVWSYALRKSGWDDSRPVWTGSCPCQPFSSAGKGSGFDDERHLWPPFQHLIKECKPAVVFGEQVASKDADAWIDLVHTDMEALGYAFGAVPFPSAGVGAPHIRDRLYWVGDAGGAGLEGYAGHGGATRRKESSRSIASASVSGGLADRHGCRCLSGREGCKAVGYGAPAESDRCACRLADSEVTGRGKRRADTAGSSERSSPEGLEQRSRDGGILGCRLADADGGDTSPEGLQRVSQHGWRQEDGCAVRSELSGIGSDNIARLERPGPTNGYWRDVDWLGCRDGKWRPVEPGTFPLAHGAASRVGRLRAYGNAINGEAAKAFIEAFIENRP